MHEVLHADWHEVWHSPHPVLHAASFNTGLAIVLTLFIFSSLCERMNPLRPMPAWYLRSVYLINSSILPYYIIGVKPTESISIFYTLFFNAINKYIPQARRARAANICLSR